MRKSIYYLIANTVSTVAALIFVACISGNLYPVFGFDLIVQSPMKTAFEPFKYVLVIEALAIVLCTYDVVSSSRSNGKKLPFELGQNIIGAVVTIVSVLYTWVSVILIFENYRIGQTISIPYFFIAFYVVGVLMLYASGAAAKKNGTVGASLIVSALLLMISGLLYECLPYWYTLVSSLGVTALVLILPSVISLSHQKRA